MMGETSYVEVTCENQVFKLDNGQAVESLDKFICSRANAAEFALSKSQARKRRAAPRKRKNLKKSTIANGNVPKVNKVISKKIPKTARSKKAVVNCKETPFYEMFYKITDNIKVKLMDGKLDVNCNAIYTHMQQVNDISTARLNIYLFTQGLHTHFYLWYTCEF